MREAVVDGDDLAVDENGVGGLRGARDGRRHHGKCKHDGRG